VAPSAREAGWVAPIQSPPNSPAAPGDRRDREELTRASRVAGVPWSALVRPLKPLVPRRGYESSWSASICFAAGPAEKDCPGKVNGRTVIRGGGGAPAPPHPRGPRPLSSAPLSRRPPARSCRPVPRRRSRRALSRTAKARTDFAAKAAAGLEKRLESVAAYNHGGCPTCRDAEARAFLAKLKRIAGSKPTGG